MNFLVDTVFVDFLPVRDASECKHARNIKEKFKSFFLCLGREAARVNPRDVLLEVVGMTERQECESVLFGRGRVEGANGKGLPFCLWYDVV